ncbi:hypothetical protein [Rhodopirellula sp. MGV]|nr:hypothetical protein [Rhodopirellula sp. MGV]
MSKNDRQSDSDRTLVRTLVTEPPPKLFCPNLQVYWNVDLSDSGALTED